MATQYPLDLNKIKEMLNRPDSVKDLNNKEMNNIIQKQHELTMLVEKLRTSIRTDFSDMKQILNDNSKKYNNNSYLMNLKFKQHANFSEEVTKINKKITELTQEIYNDIIKLRSNEYKYQTLSKKEKMNLDKMVIDYKKKYAEIKKLDDTYSGGYLDKYLEDTEVKIRNRTKMYISASAILAGILAVSIIIFRKK
jgi:hypothetical protein